MKYIGIDPGASGGIASLNGDVISLIKMPSTERDVWEWIRKLVDGGEVYAVIENVSAMPGNGVVGMFVFGQGFGGLRMALTAAEIPFELVRPMTWQKALGIPPRKKGDKWQVPITKGKNKGKMQTKEMGGENKMAFKKRLRAFAQRLFPNQDITLETADALLIALYAKRKMEGNL